MANPNSRLDLLRTLLITTAVFWIFTPSLHGGWLMDDDFYLPRNALLHDPARLWKIWFAPGSLIEYYPMEATLQAALWHIWQYNTFGYHLTNVLLHLTGALLVWRLLEKFGLRLAWLGGFLFAIHPVMVESVAWISEFKNVLSLPPFLLAMCFWMDYEEHKRPRDYLLALGLFLFAMLCKITMAFFPIVILLYAWWKRGRVGWSDLKASIPFFVISVALGVTVILAADWFRIAHMQPWQPFNIGGFLPRVAQAGSSMAVYFSHCIWPVELLPLYPKWTTDPPQLWEFIPWLVLGGIVGLCWRNQKTWGRHVLLGLGFFLINLLPFIGFMSGTYMDFTWVMDHFLYLPMVGLIGLIVAGLGLMEKGFPAGLRWVGISVMAMVLALLALESHWYAGKFVNQEVLWTYTIAHNPNAWLARNNLGNELFNAKRFPEAIVQYEEALRINPYMAEAHNNLGLALSRTGHPEEAILQYEAALKSNPHFDIAHINLADALYDAGRIQEAIAHYQEALIISPGNIEVREKLAKLKAK